jgi:23S rRNA (cytosine1962-C5)-methyltransferase
LAEQESTYLKIQLQKDLIKNIKRGHCWVYADALRSIPAVKPGTPAVLLDNRGGKAIAVGFLDPQHPIAFRVCSTHIIKIDDENWLLSRLQAASKLRYDAVPPSTDAFRLINGEGDGLPGLICDLYQDFAVLQFDSPACMEFYDQQTIIHWLRDTYQIRTVIDRSRFNPDAQILFGSAPSNPVAFLECRHSFTADLLHGQKTGFFLDQRENRRQIEWFATDKSVLNLFGYTGGFSIYAGMGGARHVTTVDIAKPAVEMAQEHWLMNELLPEMHESIAMDAYQFLDESIKQRRKWDIVIVDPPSFAHSEATIPQALAAYKKLVEKGAFVTNPDGYLAVSSCSSHVTREMFLQCCEEGISSARRKALVLRINSQPADHPAPLVMQELQYLKFVLLKLVDE